MSRNEHHMNFEVLDRSLRSIYIIRNSTQDDEDDLTNNKYDIHVDFYYHIENVLLNKFKFDDDILNVDLTKVNVIKSSEKLVVKIFELMQKNYSLNNKKKMRLAKALLCWQCQFDDLNLIMKTINFIHEYFSSNDETSPDESLSSIGDFETTSKETNTLFYSIHSGSMSIMQLMVENYGTRLIYRSINDTFINPFDCVIRENQLHLLSYLLEKYYLQDFSSVSDLLEESVYYAITESSLEAVQILLKFYLCKQIIPDKSMLVNVCKLISFKLNSTESMLELKLSIFKLIFENFNLKITTKIKFLNNYANNNLDESLFSICFEFTNYRMFTFFIDILKQHEPNKCMLQEILIDTFINKMKRSFECNIKLIEILLQHIHNKKLLYNKLARYDKGRLIKPCENHLKSSKIFLPRENGYSKQTNSYFIKHSLLVKYDIVPINRRLFWLANYIYYWTIVCSNRSEYVSASSLLRFISIEELIDLVTNYFGYLIEAGLINSKKKSSIFWWLNLKNQSKMSMLNSQDMNRLESGILNIYENNRRLPFSLKMIARNRVRFLLVSLSNNALSSLNLPKHLEEYVKNDTL